MSTSSPASGPPETDATASPAAADANDNMEQSAEVQQAPEASESAPTSETTDQSENTTTTVQNPHGDSPVEQSQNQNDSENEDGDTSPTPTTTTGTPATTASRMATVSTPPADQVSSSPAADSSAVTVPPLPRIENNRPLIKMSFSRKRSTFGRYIQHTQYDASDSYRFCTSFVDPKFVTKRVERDFGAQNVKPRKTVAVQTPRYRKVNKMSQCETVLNENVQVDGDSLNNFLTTAQDKVARVLQRNEKFKLFEDDFAELATDDVVGTKTTNRLKKGDQTYTHMDNKNKKISCVDWQPKTKGVVAFAVVDPRPYEERVQSYGKAQSSYIVVWNFVDPIYPQVVLEAPADVLCFKFNPYNPNIIIAGLINGQVAMWDLKMVQDGEKQLKWTHSSLIELSHKASVNDLQWILHKQMKNDRLVENNSDSCNQFITVGADGKIIIWDIRIDNLKSSVKAGIRKNEKLKGAWIPYHTMNMHQMDGATEVTGQALSICQENPYIFACTSQEGDFLQGDWTPRIVSRPDEEYDPEEEHISKKEKSIITHSFRTEANGAHFGAANMIDRHPLFTDFYLTSGDWTFKIWKCGGEITRPILSSPYSEISSFVTCGKWSPTRPAVLFIGKSDGKLEVWDFLDKSHEASMIFTINTQASITSINFRVGTGASKYSVTICAVGTSIGTLHVVEMPRNLIKPHSAEEQLMSEFLKREEQCVRYYSQRWLHHSLKLDEIKQERDTREKAQNEVKKKSDAKSDEPDYNAMTEKFLSILQKYEENQEQLLHGEDEED